jgi:hypothetical protein
MEWFKRLTGQHDETEQVPPSLQAGAREFVDRVAPSELQIELVIGTPVDPVTAPVGE